MLDRQGDFVYLEASDRGIGLEEITCDGLQKLLEFTCLVVLPDFNCCVIVGIAIRMRNAWPLFVFIFWRRIHKKGQSSDAKLQDKLYKGQIFRSEKGEVDGGRFIDV